jgi:hypothetical protein
MTKLLINAMIKLLAQDVAASVCYQSVSPGQMPGLERSKTMKDRFTDASTELTEQNAYVCDSCTETFGHETIQHLADDTRWPGEAMDVSTCLINCDPMPFGD